MEATPNNARVVLQNAKASISCVAYEDLYGFNGTAKQLAAAKIAFTSLGIEDPRAVADSIDTMLTSTKKYKSEEYYDRLFTNFEEATSAIKNSKTTSTLTLHCNQKAFLDSPQFFGLRARWNLLFILF